LVPLCLCMLLKVSIIASSDSLGTVLLKHLRKM